MSCNEWERGTITIPASEWQAFRKYLHTSAVEEDTKRYELALRIWKILKDPAIIKRCRDKVKAWNAKQPAKKRVLLKHVHAKSVCDAVNDWGSPIEVALIGWENRVVPHWLRELVVGESQRIETDLGALFTSPERGSDKRPKLLKPKKGKPIPFKTVRYQAGWGGDISLDLKARTVTWEVEENNHACDSARNSHMGEAFFGALDHVTWKRGSGGTIVGNDEYSIDAGRGEAGGGANYEKNTYGPNMPAPTRNRGPRAFSGFGW